MADASTVNPLLDLWRKQFEESAAAWTRMVGQAPPPSTDPTAFWRPVLNQGLEQWARLFAQTPMTPDLATQWKQFMDQWIEGWSKALGQAMNTDAVGDYNPVHSDPAYAATTPFKAPIAPGIFTAGLISAVIGTQLPGPGAIYLSQSLKFVKPVKSGDRITARVEVIEVIGDRNRIRLQTVCVNQNGEEVLSGEAWVMPSKTRVVYEPRPRTPPPGP